MHFAKKKCKCLHSHLAHLTLDLPVGLEESLTLPNISQDKLWSSILPDFQRAIEEWGK